MSNLKAILIPGNGDANPEEIWYPYVKRELDKLGILTTNVKFPDPVLARKEYWLPFIKKLGADEDTILIGHSSGAIASMRYVESHKILGTVLVGAYASHLDNEDEKKSGYFDAPWDWKSIRKNQKWIIQFASTDDPFIPIIEARAVAKHLKTEYYEYTDRSHFGSDNDELEFPEMIEAIREKISI